MNLSTARASGRLVRIGALSAVVLSSAVLAGCTFGNRGLGSNNGQQGTINFNTDNGTGSLNFGENGISITGEDGNSTASFGQSLPSNWPSDLPTPNDASLLFSGATEADGEISFSASYSSTQSVESALADMKSKFQSAGWTVEGDYNASFEGSVSAGFGAKKGNQDASVLIGSDTSEPGQLSITVGATY